LFSLTCMMSKLWTAQLHHTLQMHGDRMFPYMQLLIRTLTQELSGRITDPLAIRLRERVLPMRCDRCTSCRSVCGSWQVLYCLMFHLTPL
jgi:hypothetical protein